MNIQFQSIVFSLFVYLGSSFFITVNAVPPVPRPTPQAPIPEIVYTVGDLSNAILDIEEIPDAPEGCVIEKVVFARGIQSYKSNGDEWGATGPLAQLFDTNLNLGNLFDPAHADDEIIVDETVKIGTHYQSLTTPGWEFPAGRAIVKAGSVLRLGSPVGYIAWLNAGLEDAGLPSLGYNRLYRVLTIAGVSPAYRGKPGATVGSGYTTFYVFLSGCMAP